ncbi:MAG: outer membrane protein assembly factor BamE [Novosphingobium sp.]|nr:outer membrane protein assembly factor BamE [Novosphingobium sp.]
MTIIRDCGNPAFPPPADFVHFDQSRQSIGQFIDQAAAAAPRRFRHVELFNLWRSITPPPQDVPLALCDQRTSDEADWVFGNTLEPGMAEGSPYTTSIFNPAQRWHYVSNLTPDEVIVFRQYDSRPGAPMGCLHGAFAWPKPLAGAIPRASIEVRIFAFFDG